MKNIIKIIFGSLLLMTLFFTCSVPGSSDKSKESASTNSETFFAATAVTIEAETMSKSGYSNESNSTASGGQVIKLSSSSGSVTKNFTGTTGTYDISIVYIDQPTDAATFNFLIGGVIIGTWTGNQATTADLFITKTFTGITVANGAQIKLSGAKSGTELAKYDVIKFTPNGSTSSSSISSTSITSSSSSTTTSSSSSTTTSSSSSKSTSSSSSSSSATTSSSSSYNGSVSSTIIVAQNGSGNFTTIQSAINAIPMTNASWITIIVKNGVYNEHVFIDKSYIALIGENRDNTRIELALDRSVWNSQMGSSNAGSGVVDIGVLASSPITTVAVSDIFIGNMSIVNTIDSTTYSGTVYTHAIRGEKNATKITVAYCNVLATGSDTLALWNTTTGMYYHTTCTFKGKIDAICPRGWCYDVGSTYTEVGNSAPIWHEGATGSGQKYVIRNAYIQPDTGKNFKLLNGQKESTVYLLDSFLYDYTGYTIAEGSVSAAYFYNNNMQGGNPSWLANNLTSAPNSPTQSQITAYWTFNSQWDPENTLPAVLPYASIPQPWDKAYEVSSSAQLKWIKAKDATSYNIYFGTTSSPSLAGSTAGNSFTPGSLAKGTTYYWRIDAVTPNGTIQGQAWSFTVSSN